MRKTAVYAATTQYSYVRSTVGYVATAWKEQDPATQNNALTRRVPDAKNGRWFV
jgi:hypothetical protein